MGRGLSVLILVLALTGIGIAFGALVVPPLVNQATGLADDVPTYVNRLAQRDDFIGEVVRRNDVAPKIQSFIEQLPQRAGNRSAPCWGSQAGWEALSSACSPS